MFTTHDVGDPNTVVVETGGAASIQFVRDRCLGVQGVVTGPDVLKVLSLTVVDRVKIETGDGLEVSVRHTG